MKKIILVCLVFLGMSMALFADAVSDTQFRQYVELTRKHKNNPKGMTVTADYTYRIIYVAMPMPMPNASSDILPQVMANMKKAMLAELRKQKADCKIMKNLKIQMVYTFITSDRKVFSISISYLDI